MTQRLVLQTPAKTGTRPVHITNSVGRVDSWVHEDADSRKEQRRQGVYTEINDAAEQRIDEEDAPQGPKWQHALTCGGKDLWIIAGPCAVESFSQLEEVATTLLNNGVVSLRGGAFKPRTSPYSFQGLGKSGLEMLDFVRKQYGIVVVTEVMTLEQIEDALQHADVLQIGSRNMQNFPLLKELGKVDKPILLKRGLAATLDEFLWAAEYILSEGNTRVILCERGIRSFDPETRNVIDLGGVAVLKKKTHLPVIVDPSHAAGRRDIISDISRAAIAVGADGLLIEIHPDPDRSVSDSAQALSLEDFSTLMQDIAPIANAMGRTLTVTDNIPLTSAVTLSSASPHFANSAASPPLGERRSRRRDEVEPYGCGEGECPGLKI